MIRASQPHLPVVAISDRGRQRHSNEDRYRISAFVGKKDPAEPMLLAVLADGVGGHLAGEVAAELAVEQIERYVETHAERLPPELLLAEAMRHAGEVIYHQGETNPLQRGMGATCVAALIAGLRLYIANVGDSRIYLMRERQTLRLSTDHTWIQEALDLGLITPEEALTHPNAHIIRQYLGSAQPPEVDLRLRLQPNESNAQALANQGMLLKAGDRLLLCSDGLSDLVHDDEIGHILQHHPLEEAASMLVDLANLRGGHDNITLIIIGVPQPPETP